MRPRKALFLQNEKEQGAPSHAETVFDLTPEEIVATFALLKHVKAWMDERYHPDGTTWGGTAGRLEDKSPCTPTCTSCPGFGRNLMLDVASGMAETTGKPVVVSTSSVHQ